MNIKSLTQSLAFRTSSFLLIVIVIAQLLAGLIWFQQTSERDKKGLLTTVNSLALSASSTIAYFQSLPSEYRHLALDQLRSMGGTRFFVSLNDHEISVKTLSESQRKSLVINEVRNVLNQELAGNPKLNVDFTLRKNLRVFNNELPIDELPQLWAHYSLSYGNLNPPILVTQVEVAPNEWFYLAAVLPAPYVELETNYFAPREWLTFVLSAFLLLSFTWLIVRREVRPIRALAKAATQMSSHLIIPKVKEEGSTELQAAVKAFNKMNQRIESHIKDREMLFSSISHDLKTPIACLKLRAEMLDDDVQQERFSKIANDLDLMVKGALQCIKETDIHEDIEPIDIIQLIEHIKNTFPTNEQSIQLSGSLNCQFVGKPLAIKRCLVNLIDNAIKYGEKAYVDLSNNDEWINIEISDEGQQLAPEQLPKLFEPYYRLSTSSEGNGLGLTISQSIVKSHAGDIQLSTTKRGGLRVTLFFPRV